MRDIEVPIRTTLLMTYRKDSSEIAIVRLSTADRIIGNETAILHKLKKTGKYDTDQAVWLPDTRPQQLKFADAIEEVAI